MDLETEALLMFAARREHLAQVIVPALTRGDWVISDRFTDATFAYQGGGRGMSLDKLSQLERLVQAVPALEGLGAQHPEAAIRQPDLTIWFDLPAAVAAERLTTARVPDKFEAQPGAFFAAVAAGYARRAEAAPQRFARIDANTSREAVWQQVADVLQAKGWLQPGVLA